MTNKILLGAVSHPRTDTGGEAVYFDLSMANRHGMIAGATGTGKTVTLQLLAEGFANAGVPVFLADIKGDLSGLAQPGKDNDKIAQRMRFIGLDKLDFAANAVAFWDIFAENGHPVRTTISEIGPLLLSSLLQLNDTQTGILYSCFQIADDNGMLLLDMKDLRAMLNWMAENRKQLSARYGNISTASIGAIQRRLLILREQGAEHFFGEKALELNDLCRVDFSGRGIISLLDATRLSTQSPQLYAVFLLWLLSETYESFPEVGDLEKPKFVMFFDEAHLLFHKAPQILVDKIEQIVRLIRSKGVGVYFVSQNPLDVPDKILGQLGLKIQHALRAFTPKEKKTLNVVADTFRANPQLDTRKVITELEIGEALISVLDQKAAPTMVQRVMLCPPKSTIGALDSQTRNQLIARSPFAGKYEQVIDRESAFEILQQRAEEHRQQQEQQKEIQDSPNSRQRGGRQGVVETLFKSVARTVGRQIGRQLVRGILGSLGLGKR